MTLLSTTPEACWTSWEFSKQIYDWNAYFQRFPDVLLRRDGSSPFFLWFKNPLYPKAPVMNIISSPCSACFITYRWNYGKFRCWCWVQAAVFGRGISLLFRTKVKTTLHFLSYRLTVTRKCSLKRACHCLQTTYWTLWLDNESQFYWSLSSPLAQIILPNSSGEWFE